MTTVRPVITAAELDKLADLMDLDSIPADMQFPDAIEPLSKLAQCAADIGFFDQITHADVYCWAVPGDADGHVICRWFTSPRRYPGLKLSTGSTFPGELIANARAETGRDRARVLLNFAFAALAETFGLFNSVAA